MSCRHRHNPLRVQGETAVGKTKRMRLMLSIHIVTKGSGAETRNGKAEHGYSPPRPYTPLLFLSSLLPFPPAACGRTLWGSRGPTHTPPVRRRKTGSIGSRSPAQRDMQSEVPVAWVYISVGGLRDHVHISTRFACCKPTASESNP